METLVQSHASARRIIFSDALTEDIVWSPFVGVAPPLEVRALYESGVDLIAAISSITIGSEPGRDAYERLYIESRDRISSEIRIFRDSYSIVVSTLTPLSNPAHSTRLVLISSLRSAALPSALHLAATHTRECTSSPETALRPRFGCSGTRTTSWYIPHPPLPTR